MTDEQIELALEQAIDKAPNYEPTTPNDTIDPNTAKMIYSSLL